MSSFFRTWSARPPARAKQRAALALCGVALGLSALGCSSESSEPDVTGSGKGAESDDDVEQDDESATAGGKKDASAPIKSGKADASVAASKPDASVSDTGDAGRESTAGNTTKSLWCDALKVFQDKCQSCHSDPIKAGAPMSLVTYADAVAAAPVTKGKKVYETVGARVHDTTNPMPPGKPLPAAELAAIDAWIADGAQAGSDESCSGQKGPVVEEQAWPPAGCTETYKLTAGKGKKVSVAAGAETHPQVVMDAPWGDADVQAIGFRPITDNAKILHHWILNANGGAAAFINGWAPGQDDSQRKPLPDDVGVFLPKGKSSLRLDMHYNNLQGTAVEVDDSGLEVCITRMPRKNVATTFSGFMAIPFIAPGQEVDMVGTCNVSVSKPVFLLSESPHAHKLAKHMKFEVKRAGKTTVLHDAPFAFDGQTATPLDQPFELKSGDQVITTCHFKNDTNRLVTFGENTGNEMCFNFASYYPMGALSCNGQAPIDLGTAFGGGTP